MDNMTRAADALKALTVFAESQRMSIEKEGLETVAADMLANTMHLCALNGVDFQAVVTMARAHYDAEVMEEESTSSYSC